MVKYKINDSNNDVTVTVVIERKYSPKQVVTTEKVKKYLESEGIKTYSCISESYICNRNEVFSGTWVFNKRKPKKVIDKKGKNVIRSKSSSNKRRIKRNYNLNIEHVDNDVNNDNKE